MDKNESTNGNASDKRTVLWAIIIVVGGLVLPFMMSLRPDYTLAETYWNLLTAVGMIYLVLLFLNWLLGILE